MAAYSPHELWKLWSRQQISVEIATGHMLQNLVALQETVDAMQRALAQSQTSQVNVTPTQSAPRRTKRRKQ